MRNRIDKTQLFRKVTGEASSATRMLLVALGIAAIVFAQGCSGGDKPNETAQGAEKSVVAEVHAESTTLDDKVDAAGGAFGYENGQPEHEHDENALKVFFVYPSPVGDAGWSFAHDEARKEIEKIPGVQTGYLESVLGIGYTETVLENVAKSNDLVFTTSYEYMDPTMKVAERFPNVVFMHCSGYKRRENVGTYFGRMYMARYLTGIVAAGMSKKGEIGYVAAFRIPEVIRGLNAFTLGAQTVNPDVKVRVIWTETWYNPELERKSAEELVKMGVDVLAQDQDSPASQQVAQEHDIYSIGYNVDMSKYAPEAHLTSAIWRWDILYADIVNKVKDGTWKSEDIWWGIKEGVVGLAPFGPMVPKELADRTLRAQTKLADGSLVLFSGPVLDSNGHIHIPAGHVATDKELLEMNWYVNGVVNH